MDSVQNEFDDRANKHWITIHVYGSHRLALSIVLTCLFCSNHRFIHMKLLSGILLILYKTVFYYHSHNINHINMTLNSKGADKYDGSHNVNSLNQLTLSLRKFFLCYANFSHILILHLVHNK